jgi:hypothetical protein
MNKRKAFSYGMAVFLLLVGFASISQGFILIIQPDGGGSGLPLELLADTPFKDFLIPGIALLTFNGFGSLIGAFLVYKNHQLAGKMTTLLGIAMIIWISTQVYWIGFASWLQPTFLFVGASEMIIGYLLEALHHRKWNIFKGPHDFQAH